MPPGRVNLRPPAVDGMHRLIDLGCGRSLEHPGQEEMKVKEEEEKEEAEEHGPPASKGLVIPRAVLVRPQLLDQDRNI